MPARARKKTPVARPKSKRASAKAGAKRRALTAREKMRAYRARMRARGFKLVQTWVPDTSRPGFAEEIRRQLLLIKDSPGEREAIEFLDELAEDMNEWK